MFKDFPVFGVLLAVAILVGIVWVSIKMTKNLIANDKVNFLLVLITSSLVGVWVIDNVVAFKTQLLDPDKNKFIIQCLMIFGSIGIARTFQQQSPFIQQLLFKIKHLGK